MNNLEVTDRINLLFRSYILRCAPKFTTYENKYVVRYVASGVLGNSKIDSKLSSYIIKKFNEFDAPINTKFDLYKLCGMIIEEMEKYERIKY